MIDKPPILPVLPPVLEYAQRKPSNAIPFPKTIHSWRNIAGVCIPFLLCTVADTWPVELVGWVAAVAFMVAIVMVLYYMTKMAAQEVDVAYAVRHLMLAILLMPIMFLGIFLVPKLIEWDVIKWRQQDKEAAALNRE